MSKDKEYIPPKCFDLSLEPSARTQGACSYGSIPAAEDPCWNGSSPTGYDGECSNGTTPSEGVCYSTGSTPSAGGACISAGVSPG